MLYSLFVSTRSRPEQGWAWSSCRSFAMSTSFGPQNSSASERGEAVAASYLSQRPYRAYGQSAKPSARRMICERLRFCSAYSQRPPAVSSQRMRRVPGRWFALRAQGCKARDRGCRSRHEAPELSGASRRSASKLGEQDSGQCMSACLVGCACCVCQSRTSQSG